MYHYRLNELEGTQLVPLPTNKKAHPPRGWTGSKATPQDIEEFYNEHAFAEYSNQGLAITGDNLAGFDFDLHRNGQTLSEVTNGQELPWTVGVSRRWEPEVDGFTVFYRTAVKSSTLTDATPVDVIRKGYRYSVINGEADDLEYFLYWTNGVQFHRLDPNAFAEAWECLPEAPEWLLERHKKPSGTRTRPTPVRSSEGATDVSLVLAELGDSTSCRRVQAVAAKGVRSTLTARASGGSINQAMMLAQWALSAYVYHSGYASALASVHNAYERACANTEGEHPYSTYEWEKSLEGAYEKRGITKIEARRCACSAAPSTRTAPPCPSSGASLSDYYPLIGSELTRAGFYGPDAEDLAQEVAIKVLKANPKKLTAAYIRSAVKSVSVDEYRRRATREKMIQEAARVRVVSEQTREDSHHETLNRLVIEQLAATLSPREAAAVTGHLKGEQLNSSLRVGLTSAKKKMLAAALA